MSVFWPVALSVGLGQLVVCYALGIPLMVLLQKTGLSKQLETNSL